jgi:tetratricopeptide (TPR) repeat protein
MSKMPPALVEALRLRQVAIVAGSRCSELAALPAWSQLGATLADWIEDPVRKDEVKALLDVRPVAALARVRALLDEEVVAEVIADAVPAGRELPPALVAAAKVPFRAVLTTSLDDLWERATAVAALPTVSLLPGQVRDLDDLTGRLLMPLLGRATAPETLCLGPRDLHALLVATSTAAVLAEAHRRWSFVFVGFRAGDPDLTLVLERLLGASSSTREHFLLCPGLSDDDAGLLGAELALTAVPVDGDVASALEALAETWQSVEASSRPPVEDVEAWIELWGREPGDLDAPRVLAEAAERLRGEKDWERLVAVLVQRAELAREREVQVASLREVGRIFEVELSQPDRAYRALVTALRLEPDDVELVSQLKRLARQADLWDEFVSDYGGFVETMADPADSAHHVIEMGRIYAEDSGRHTLAIASFERALTVDPGSPEALQGLESLYRQTERWGELARVLREREGRATDPVERRKLRTDRIEILFNRLHDGPAAIEALEAAVSDDPDDRVALRSLEALYKEQHREPERLATLERLLPLAESDEERVALLRRLAAGHRSRSGGADAALAALERAFALGDGHEDTLEALARAYEQRQDWRACAEVLDRWAESGSDDVRAQLLARAGKLHLEKLNDSAAGEERYARALELDPHNPAVLSAMAHLSRERGDFFRAAKFLLESEERTRNPLEKARLLYEAGIIYQERLDEEPRAVELYARALASDPGHAAAAMRLAPLYERAQSWEALEPVLDMLARRADGTDAEVADLHRRLAECALALGKDDKALRSYEAARALAPDELPVLRGLADLLLERRSWAEARAHYDTIRRLGEGKLSLSVEEKVDLYERLGRCEAQLDEADSARRRFEDAVALDPPVERKVQLLEELGDLCLERLRRPDDAIAAYQQALALGPTRRPLLHKLLGLYTEQKRWPQAEAMLMKLAELEPAPALRAKYLYAAAVIHRDELNDPARAVELLNKALDDDPDMHKAFEALERLHTEAQDWKALARAYRRMIKRLPEKGMTELAARLWNGLGVVSLRYLGDREAAILALEVASSLERENLARHELLADLYVEVGPTARDKAVAQHQFILSRRPDRIESYLSLAALFQQQQSYDRLWCVAGALTYMGHADHYLRAFWERHRPADVPVALHKMGHEQWQKVVHPKEDPLLSQLFALMWSAMALTTAQRHQTFGLKRNDRVDLNHPEWLVAKAMRYLATAFDMPLPDVFVHEGDPQTVAVYNLRDRGGLTPALVIGQGFAPWMSAPFETVFDLGRRMAFLRPERFPRFALMTPAALDIAVRAALALGGAPIGHGPHNGEVERTRSKLAEFVPQPVTHELAVMAKRFLEARGEVIDIPAWISAADLSATRAAFVLSSDLSAAVRVLSAEPAGLTPLPLADRIKDLVAYSVSEEYFAVREAMGLKVV